MRELSMTETLQERAALIENCRALLDKADAEKRSFTDEEKQAYSKLEVQIDRLTMRSKELGFDFDEAARGPGGRMENPYSSSHSTRFVTGDGSEVRALTASEKIGNGAGNKLSFSRLVRGIVVGDWTGAEGEQRAMSSLSGGAGGYLVPSGLSAQVVDLARSKAVIFQAGALTLPMENGEMTIAKLASDPTAYWRQQNVAITESQPTFEPVKMVAQTLAALVVLPIELLEDAAVSSQTIESAIAEALALELDRVALRGNGMGEPRGLYNTPNVGEVSMGTNGASLSSYSKFSEAVELVANANGVAKSVIYAPRTAGALDRLADSTGQPLQPIPSFVGLQKLVSTQVPVNLTQGSATTCSFAALGDFSNLLVGVRTQLTLEMSRGGGDAFSKMQVQMRAYLRADIAVLRPNHFAFVKGIK